MILKENYNNTVQSATIAEGRVISTNLMFVLLLATVSIGLYFNTYYNDYCLDDSMLITENKITQKGFGGIQEHLTHDFLFGYIGRSSENNAAIWRPLPLISFCIEIGLWGANRPGYSHMVNVFLFSMVVILFYMVLSRFIFKNHWLAFFAALLFALHPIHSEVVANIKSRDELFCALFILSALFAIGTYMASRRKILLFLSFIFYISALLSKESAITFLIGIPLYVYFFFPVGKKQVFNIFSLFLIVTLLFLFVRNAIVPFGSGEDDAQPLYILNNPYLLATPDEAFFTKIFIFWKYIKMLFVPYPLCFDYSYNQIPYVNASNLWVWVSVLLNGFLLVYAFRNFKSKSLLTYCILFYFLTLSTVSNFLFETAVIFAERFLFIPSLFFCMAVVYGINKLYIFLKERQGRVLAALVFLPFILLVVFFSVVIIQRNRDWKNTDQLNLADISKAPNSARINDGMGSYYIKGALEKNVTPQRKDSLFNLAIAHYSRSLELYPGFDNSLINIGVAYDNLGNRDKAEFYWDELAKYSPGHPMLKEFHNFLTREYLSKGLVATEKKILDSSEYYLSKAAKYADFDDSSYIKSWFNLGGAYYLNGKYQLSLQSLEKVLSKDPGNMAARQGYEACKVMLQSARNNSPIR